MEKIKISELKRFDLAESLNSQEKIAVYLQLVLDESDPAELAHALGVIAKARGMTQIAKDSGIGRESLYKALREGASPRFETISRVMQALGVQLTVTPVEANNDKLSTGV